MLQGKPLRKTYRKPETIHNLSWGPPGALGASKEPQEAPRAPLEPPQLWLWIVSSPERRNRERAGSDLRPHNVFRIRCNTFMTMFFLLNCTVWATLGEARGKSGKARKSLPGSTHRRRLDQDPCKHVCAMPCVFTKQAGGDNHEVLQIVHSAKASVRDVVCFAKQAGGDTREMSQIMQYAQLRVRDVVCFTKQVGGDIRKLLQITHFGQARVRDVVCFTKQAGGDTHEALQIIHLAQVRVRDVVCFTKQAGGATREVLQLIHSAQARVRDVVCFTTQAGGATREVLQIIHSAPARVRDVAFFTKQTGATLRAPPPTSCRKYYFGETSVKSPKPFDKHHGLIEKTYSIMLTTILSKVYFFKVTAFSVHCCSLAEEERMTRSCEARSRWADVLHRNPKRRFREKGIAL